MYIGRKCVESGREPMIIAEMSGNHLGKLERALQIVETAARCGASAIKLQTYTPGSLTIDSKRPEFFIDDPGGLWHGQRLWELYQEAHTPWEWHEPLFEAARAQDLLCLSTAYDLSSLELLVKLDVDGIKIASFELVHTPLIEAAAASGKPLVISTGMGTVAEIDRAVDAIRSNGCEEFVLLKCTSAYPAEEVNADIATMVDMRLRYGCEVGVSDHTLRPFVAFAATALDAAVIEKHLTIDRSEGGVDAEFSIEPAELKELVDGTTLIQRSLGGVSYGPQSVEEASLRERPSLYVVQEIKGGELFTEKNVRVIRPGAGLSPRHYNKVIGMACVRDVAPETPLTLDLVERESKDLR